MSQLKTHQTRHALGNLVFAIVAIASFAFWGFELRFSLNGYAEHELEILSTYQQRELAQKAEVLLDVFKDIHQSARSISLLPELREARGGNRRSERENVVHQGRLTPQTWRILQQIYASLSAYTSLSEIYFILDGFAPERGDVPFFMLDDFASELNAGVEASHDHAPGRPEENEAFEYAEIVNQLAWFRRNAPRFTFGSNLGAIPARISSLLLTCDNTQRVSLQPDQERNSLGFLYSLPVYDDSSGIFKGIVAVIVRANVLEAKLLDIPFVPVTSEDLTKQASSGFQMPPPSPFILIADPQKFEIADRRNQKLAAGLASARQAGGQWAMREILLPTGDLWELYHMLSDAEADFLVGNLRAEKRLSVAGRILLLLVLTTLLGWGFWLMRTSRDELLKLAHYDQLTDLPNRRLFFDHMHAGIERASRYRRKLGLFFIDLSGLNAINDRYGHHGGDLLLTKFAERLHLQLHAGDNIFAGRPADSLNFILSRLGGDEFTLLCKELQSGDDMVIIAERILACVETPFTLADEPVNIRLNVGAALYPDDAVDAERLLMSADSAMHECKNKNSRYVLFNEEMRQRGERLHLLMTELKNAIEVKQFELFYQPKATLLDGQVVSMEALIRWHHPQVGLVSPIEFIPILERNGDIVEIGKWIVEQACRDLILLDSEGFTEMKLAVNVSVHQLKRSHFYDFLKETIRTSGIDPQRLILELTESVMLEDLKKGREALLKLKELGVRIAIDDFGAGYSSLTYLQHLPLDSLKIDKSLIDGMVNERAIHVVGSVIRLAHGLSLKTIAEGIETDAQRILIRDLGCDLMQGYLLSRPLPLKDIVSWLKQRR